MAAPLQRQLGSALGSSFVGAATSLPLIQPVSLAPVGEWKSEDTESGRRSKRPKKQSRHEEMVDHRDYDDDVFGDDAEDEDEGARRPRAKRAKVKGGGGGQRRPQHLRTDSEEEAMRAVEPGPDGKFQCNWSKDRPCNKKFRSKSDLIAHFRTHTGEKPLKCTWPGCNSAFAHSSNLRQHERSHRGEKRYACRIEGCDRAFAHPTSRRDHEAKHRGERPYLCEVDGCGRSFTAKANLTRHLKEIHKLEG